MSDDEVDALKANHWTFYYGQGEDYRPLGIQVFMDKPVSWRAARMQMNQMLADSRREDNGVTGREWDSSWNYLLRLAQVKSSELPDDADCPATVNLWERIGDSRDPASFASVYDTDKFISFDGGVVVFAEYPEEIQVQSESL
jgi:hypothetical protein